MKKYLILFAIYSAVAACSSSKVAMQPTNTPTNTPTVSQATSSTGTSSAVAAQITAAPETNSMAEAASIALLIGDEKKLPGQWKIVSISASAPVAEGAKSDATTITNMVLRESSMTFNPDRTYKLTFRGDETAGAWKFSKDGKAIITKEAGKAQEMRIKDLSGSKMTLEMTTETGNTTVVLQKK